MIISPCKNCERRYVGCRDKCVPWLTYEVKKKLMYVKRKRESYLNRIVYGTKTRS